MNHVSVVMVSYHTGASLFVAVASVLKQEGLAELLLVNNGNTPDVLARLQQMSLLDARLKVLTGQGNVGFAAGFNLGAKQATGDFVVFMKPDFLLPPAALLTLPAEMERFAGTMVAAPRIVEADGSIKPIAPALTSLSRLVFRLLGLSSVKLDDNPETHDAIGTTRGVVCVRKRDYEALGGCDESYFLAMEADDFCLRVTRQGGRILCVPSVRVPQLHGAYEPFALTLLRKEHAKSFLHYFEKHFAPSAPLGVAPLVKSLIWASFAVRRLTGGLRAKRNWKQHIASRKLMLLSSGLLAHDDLPEFAGKTVLVTGATSQVGLHVVKRLLAANVAVMIASREAPLPFSHENLLWIQGDVRESGYHLHEYLADVLIHCAPLELLPPLFPLLAKAEVKRVVALGSAISLSRLALKSMAEAKRAKDYANTENEVMRLSAEHRMEWTILRPTTVYGAGLDKTVLSIARFIKRHRRYFIYPPASGRRQPVHTEDVALAVLRVVNQPNTVQKSYNISGGEVLSYRAMVERIFSVLKIKPNIVPTTFLPFVMQLLQLFTRDENISAEAAHQMNDDLMFFHDEATRDFGYQPRAFLTGGMHDIEGGLWHE